MADPSAMTTEARFELDSQAYYVPGRGWLPILLMTRDELRAAAERLCAQPVQYLTEHRAETPPGAPVGRARGSAS